MSPVWQVALAGAGTYLIRLSAVAAVDRFGSPSTGWEQTLRLIAPAVLAAIVADQLLLNDGAVDVRADWLVAAVLSAVVAWRWRSAGLTMAVGMATVWAIAGLGLA